MSKEEARLEQNSEGMGYLPGLAMDFVIFGFDQYQLKILLLEYRNTNLVCTAWRICKRKRKYE